MKRNKFLPLALACALCLCLAACGDSFESAMVRAARELESVESVHADMSLDMGFGVDILGERSTLEMGMDVSMDTSGGLTSGELTLDMLGVTLPMQYIVELDGDDCDVYLSTDGGANWETSLGLSGEGLTQGELPRLEAANGVQVQAQLPQQLDLFQRPGVLL